MKNSTIYAENHGDENHPLQADVTWQKLRSQVAFHRKKNQNDHPESGDRFAISDPDL